MNALPLPNVGTSLFVNSNGLLMQSNDNYSGRVDYMFTSQPHAVRTLLDGG